MYYRQPMSRALSFIPTYQRLISHNHIAKLTNTQVMRKWKSSVIRERIYVPPNSQIKRWTKCVPMVSGIGILILQKKFRSCTIAYFTFANFNMQDKNNGMKKTEKVFNRSQSFICLLIDFLYIISLINVSFLTNNTWL